jgi:hypothetical protein
MGKAAEDLRIYYLLTLAKLIRGCHENDIIPEILKPGHMSGERIEIEGEEKPTQ